MNTRFVLGRVIAPAVIALATALPASAEPNMDKYNKSCAVCHNVGAAGHLSLTM